MKKKRWLILLMIVGVLLITFTASIGVLLAKGYGASTGVYLESKDGAAILVRGRTPILLSSQYNGDMFSTLGIGDKAFVIHSGVEETYPARTRAYAVFKISKGEISDVPQQVVEELSELGLLETEKETSASALQMPEDAYSVIKVTDEYLIVGEFGDDGAVIESMQYKVSNWFHPSTEIKIGDTIIIDHNGVVLEIEPMQFGKIYKMEYNDRDSGLSVVVIAD